MLLCIAQNMYRDLLYVFVSAMSIVNIISVGGRVRMGQSEEQGQDSGAKRRD